MILRNIMKQSTTYIRSFTHSVQKYTSIKNRSSNILVPVNVDESIMYSCIVCCCFHVTIFFGKAEVKLPLGKSRRRLEGDIKWISKKWDGILWTEFMAPFQDKWRWRADANITKKKSSWKMGNFSRVAIRMLSIRGIFRFIVFFWNVVRRNYLHIAY